MMLNPGGEVYISARPHPHPVAPAAGCPRMVSPITYLAARAPPIQVLPSSSTPFLYTQLEVSVTQKVGWGGGTNFPK